MEQTSSLKNERDWLVSVWVIKSTKADQNQCHFYSLTVKDGSKSTKPDRFCGYLEGKSSSTKWWTARMSLFLEKKDEMHYFDLIRTQKSEK